MCSSDLGDSIVVTQEHDVLAHLGEAFHGAGQFILHAFQGPAVYLAIAGAGTAWYLYLERPELPRLWRENMSGVYKLLVNKYYIDDLYIKGFAAGVRRIGQFLWVKGDELVIDGVMVNGTANTVGRLAGVLRNLQTGYLYHYAFAMVIGLCAVIAWFIW